MLTFENSSSIKYLCFILMVQLESNHSLIQFLQEFGLEKSAEELHVITSYIPSVDHMERGLSMPSLPVKASSWPEGRVDNLRPSTKKSASWSSKGKRRELQLGHQEKRSVEEKEFMSGQVKILQEELERRGEEVLCARNLEGKLENKFRAELAAQTKLATLYKSQSDEHTGSKVE